jgi:glutamate:GABA antiporter
VAGQSDTGVMATERIAPGALPRVLGSFDMTVIFIAIVLFIVQASALQPAGPAVFTYWILGFVLFLVPGALVTAQLGLMFPEEGSLFVWTQKALGPFWGFFAGFCAWWPGVLVMVATGDLVVTIWQFIEPGSLSATWEQMLVILAVLWFSAVVASMRLRLTQNYVNFQFVFYAAAIFTIGLAGAVWLTGSGHSANRLSHAHDWLPTSGNWTFFGLVILALLGIEVPLNMGVEIVHARAIKTYLFWGSAVVMVAYLWATFGNIVTIPLVDNNSTTGILSTVERGFWGQHWFAVLVGVVVLWFFVSNTVVYNYSFSRLLFVSGLERRLPPALARLNPRTHVPVHAIVLQTALASVFTVVTFGPWSSGSTFPTQVYLVFQAAVTVIWCLSMVLLFADVFLVRRSYPERFEAVRVSRTGALYLSGAVGMVASTVGAIVTFKTPWNRDLFSNGSWRLWLGLMTVVSAGAAVAIYVVSEWMRRRHEAPETAGAQVGS